MMWNLSRAWRLGLLTGLIALLFFSSFGWAYLHFLTATKQQLARNLAQNFGFRIAQRTHEAVSPAYMLASMVKQNKGGIAEFDQVATDLLQEFPLARALELAPGGIVRQVYPLNGNESIIGHDLLKDKERNKDAHLALIKRQLTLAGPFELIQGGQGLVARYPVFLQGAQGKNAFWGFVIVLLHLDQLLANSGVMDLQSKGFEYQICRVSQRAEPSECPVFSRSSADELKEPLSVMIDLPNSQWQLSVAPSAGWVSPGEWIALVLTILGGTILAGLAYMHLVRQFCERPLAVPESLSANS